jgi:UTP--glucose-1-phosphate uridylyltransferase
VTLNVKKAIIPIAGFGTRCLPITKVIPKAMLPIIYTPVIHYLVKEAVDSGIEQVIIITSEDKMDIESYFKRSKEIENHLVKIRKYELINNIKSISELADITFVTQVKPLGLGHAIYCAKDYIENNEMFAILLGDDVINSKTMPCLGQLIKIFSEYGGNILGVQRIPREFVSYYGIVKGVELSERLVQVEDLIEKPSIEQAPSNIAILGRYIIHSDIFNILKDATPGKGGEIQLTDALRILNKRQNFYAYDFEGIRYDIGDKLGYIKAITEYTLQDSEIGEEYKEYLKSLLQLVIK